MVLQFFTINFKGEPINMNLHSVFEELNKLYESEEEVKEPATEVDEVAQEPEKEELTEAAEEPAEDEIEVAIEDEVASSEEEAEEQPVAVEDEEEVRLVLECSNCGGLKVMPEAVVKVDEESDLANVEDVCQYCESAEGYRILGALTVYEAAVEEIPEDEEVEDIEEADEEAEIVEEQLDEGIFDSDKKKQQLYNTEIKKTTGKGVTEIANAIAGTCTSLLYACTGEVEDEPSLINQVVTQLNGAITRAKNTPNAAVHAVMNIGRQFAYDSFEFERLQDEMKILDKVREIPKIGQKATGYLFDQINAKVIPALEKAVNGIKSSN
jgi:hypothetical protein